MNKPSGISSAQVIRDLQNAFNPSQMFSASLQRERQRMTSGGGSQKERQRQQRKAARAQVKLGHGGTLDPMATGVLIVGVFDGTKQLSTFLGCTKDYEATLLLAPPRTRTMLWAGR